MNKHKFKEKLKQLKMREIPLLIVRIFVTVVLTLAKVVLTAVLDRQEVGSFAIYTLHEELRVWVLVRGNFKTESKAIEFFQTSDECLPTLPPSLFKIVQE